MVLRSEENYRRRPAACCVRFVDAAAWGIRATVTLAPVLLAGAAAAAEGLLVHAESHGSSVIVEARATVHASLPVAWTTLTDYAHLADFVPGLSESRVIERRGAEATLEEHGDLRCCLFLHFPVEVRLVAVEHYPSAIDARSVGGNVKLLSGAYTLRRIDDEHFELRWTGVVEPQFWTPMFITVAVLRENVERQFGAMVLEIERRQALKAQGGP